MKLCYAYAEQFTAYFKQAMSDMYLNYIRQWQYKRSCMVAGHADYPVNRHSVEL